MPAQVRSWALSILPMGGLRQLHVEVGARFVDGPLKGLRSTVTAQENANAPAG